MTLEVPELILLSVLAFASFYVMGMTGAANAIVFNAAFLAAANLGLIQSVSLHDALYWLALANLLAGALLAIPLSRHLTWEPLVGRYLLGMLPVTVVLTLLLATFSADAVRVILAAALILSGLVLGVRGVVERLSPSRAMRLAAPVGAGAGILAGLFGMGGPITLLFFSATTGTTAKFRARVFVIGLASSVVRVLLLAGSGVMTVDRLSVFGATVPAIAGGLLLGHAVHPHVGPRVFALLMGGVVVLAGASTVLVVVLR